ncbi:MAG TPA: hypothetical protein VKB12_08910 [Pyrinomonadaceae bacterium]|nr:hypothetical protein [Pyrinomonadaceae bacterium]
MADTPERSHAKTEAGGDESGEGGDDSLQELARDERELARERATRELGREPSEEEIDDWLRRQTEGY